MSAGGALRLFLGLPLPEPAAAAAADIAAARHGQAPRLKWVDPALYHLTLRFLGETLPARLDALVAAFGPLAAAAAPFTLRLGALETLPRGRGARVLALAVAEGAAPLIALAAALERGSCALGYPAETRAFRAHLTLARSRQGETLPQALITAPSGGEPPLGEGSPQPAWRAEAVLLIESELSSRGPRYRTRATLPLGGPAAAP